MKAMILAAGRGSRMRPLTDNVPKPLLEVHGKPLIEWHIDRLRDAGVQDIVINIAWLGEQIIKLLGNGDNYGVSINYSDERESGMLETGGGLIRALPLLGDEPFFAINGDIWCGYALPASLPLESTDLAHLLLVDNPKHNPDGDFKLIGGRISKGAGPALTFSGMGYYHPELFAGYAPGKQSSVPILVNAMNQGLVSGEHFTDTWHDIGTPERLAEINQQPL